MYHNKTSQILQQSGFFYFFWVILQIGQINNIFIPLSFHWRTCYNTPDWNIRWFLVSPLTFLGTDNGGEVVVYLLKSFMTGSPGEEEMSEFCN
jgi:hypothetical protein